MHGEQNNCRRSPQPHITQMNRNLTPVAGKAASMEPQDPAEKSGTSEASGSRTAAPSALRRGTDCHLQGPVTADQETPGDPLAGGVRHRGQRRRRSSTRGPDRTAFPLRGRKRMHTGPGFWESWNGSAPMIAVGVERSNWTGTLTRICRASAGQERGGPISSSLSANRRGAASGGSCQAAPGRLEQTSCFRVSNQEVMRPPVGAASRSAVTLLRGPLKASRSFESQWHWGGRGRAESLGRRAYSTDLWATCARRREESRRQCLTKKLKVKQPGSFQIITEEPISKAHLVHILLFLR
ncbi:uncharacterized protein [Paramormyrops kingsleyae]|uniref:uncharacterized protein isoform X2 n=1 Tax=Paramormyrops kingsleyae TaxID=1676925 RepID=UPI003B972351